MKIRVMVTEVDIQGAGRNGTDNPIARALCRATGQPWDIWLTSHAFELAPPFRCVILPGEIFKINRVYHYSGMMWPFEFEFDLDGTEHAERRWPEPEPAYPEAPPLSVPCATETSLDS